MNPATRPMARLRHLLVTAALLGLMASAQAQNNAQEPVKLIGTGASFPVPLYLRWFRDYHLAHPHIRVDYQSIGSAGGVKDLIAGRVDFAGTDLRLTPEEAAEVPGGVRQLPLAAGGIVVIYNLDGVPALKLSRKALVDIFSGTIARWNDAAIAATNPEASLPDKAISVVARADASGTSFKFTRYLSVLSREFAADVGTTMTPDWPDPLKQHAGLIRAPGNGGVAASVRAIPGSIGYVQYAYGLLPGISIAALENRAGKIVAPGKAAFDAARSAIMADVSTAEAKDPVNEAAYPIVALSWLVLRKEYDDPAKAAALEDLIAYALGPGQAVTERLGYLPFPESVKDYAREQLQ
ncbi:phosphate ABC transporter substrate-binding protein PstS [Thiohalocapsa halophila]